MHPSTHPPLPADTALAPRQLTATETQRVLGAMIGSAVGDALGAPFEFGPADAYTQRFAGPVHGGIGEMVGGGGFGWAPAEFTDDTQMAAVIARSLLDTGRYDPDVLWARWRIWAAAAADVGIATRASLRFDDWRSVTVPDPERTAGNGALMRATPLAVAWLGADDALVRQIVLHQAALTHQHPAAGWGAWFAVAMMRAAIGGGDMFATLEAELAAAPAEITEQFGPILHDNWTPEQPVPSNGTVWGCLAQAVWAVRHHDRFDDAVIEAIDLGGDTDTVAAVTGALAGARAGIQQIPSRWVTYLHGSVATPDGVEHVSQADLQQLALALAGATVSAEGPADQPLGPIEVAPGLYAANLSGAEMVPDDWAVVSLCRTGTMFVEHPIRRQVYLIDLGGDRNGDLATVVTDTVDAIDAFLAEGRNVVVHCHGGHSRTPLILKAWKMRRDGVDHATAQAWLEASWPHSWEHNRSFSEFLEQR